MLNPAKGHLAGENLTYDFFVVVESPSFLYVSVGKDGIEIHPTESLLNIKDKFLTFFLLCFMIIMSQNVHVHLNLLN